MTNRRAVPFPTRGRPPGIPNRATGEMKAYWHLFFSSPEYREAAKERILSGQAPHLESYFLNRVYGKPHETVDLHVGVDLDLGAMTTAELAERASALLLQLREAEDVEHQLALEPYIDVEPTRAQHSAAEPSPAELQRRALDTANPPAVYAEKQEDV